MINCSSGVCARSFQSKTNDQTKTGRSLNKLMLVFSFLIKCVQSWTPIIRMNHSWLNCCYKQISLASWATEHLCVGLSQKNIFLPCCFLPADLRVDGRWQTRLYETYETEMEHNFCVLCLTVPSCCGLAGVWHRSDNVCVLVCLWMMNLFWCPSLLLVPLPRLFSLLYSCWKIILAAATIINDSIRLWMLFCCCSRSRSGSRVNL